ncbi:MAG TPA: inorganic phosphate transporter [Solirubrobacteraceae bacterium]|nr:inorganic phosphate transporter [Solirubrobacteraceae bacterium]
MDAGFVIAIALALAFAVTNGLHDAANSMAALVATRGATPLQAIVLASVFNLLGPLLLGAAVADTIGGIVTVSPSAANQVIGAGLAAAVAWNVATWRRGLPSSSAQALVGGLVGAAIAEGGVDAVNWGGLQRGHPVGVLGTLIWLAIAPPVGALAALLVIKGLRGLAHRATRRWSAAVRAGQWASAAALAFSHGANDAQKAVGVIAALLLANGRISSLAASPRWVILASATALTAGTALGGWPIIRTVGHRIYRIHSMEGLASTAASAGVLFAGSVVGAPLSTSQVVASSIVGVGGGRSRWHHVHWEVVGYLLAGWAITLPVTGVLAAAIFAGWRLI